MAARYCRTIPLGGVSAMSGVHRLPPCIIGRWQFLQCHGYAFGRGTDDLLRDRGRAEGKAFSCGLVVTFNQSDGNDRHSRTSDNGDNDIADTVDVTFHPVTGDDRTDAGGRAGKDQIAGCEFDQSGKTGNGFRHAPDLLGKIA